MPLGPEKSASEANGVPIPGRNHVSIRIANAPCSWGTLEFEGMKGERIGHAQMLDELRDTGYEGTELGDWGFMPTEPAKLSAELAGRGLAMVGAFVPVALAREEEHAAGEAEAVKIAKLLASVAEKGPAARLPFIVLADNNGADPVRTANAGRVKREMGLSAAQWNVFARGAERIARAVQAEAGLGRSSITTAPASSKRPPKSPVSWT